MICNISTRMAAIKDGGIKMSLQGKKVLVVGTGKSGIAATELLCANGIDTVLFDGNKELDSKALYEKAPKLKEVPLILGDLTDEQMDEFDVAVLSPGVPTDIPGALKYGVRLSLHIHLGQVRLSPSQEPTARRPLQP